MFDLIIPVYNNFYELLETLRSCGRWFKKEEVLISIVDDGSDNITDEMYANLSSMFPYLQIQIFRLKKNRGPGEARQYVIDRTKNPYVMFLDSGDLFISVFCLPNYIQFIKDNPDNYLYVPSYIYEQPSDNIIIVNHHHQLHGVVLSREFITKFNIRFPKVASYMNEDTALMAFCHLLAEDEDKYVESNIGGPYILHTYNPTSLTNFDKSAYYYRNAVKGMILGATEIIVNHPDLNLTNYILVILIYGFAVLQDCGFYNKDYYKESLPIYTKFYRTYAKSLIEQEPQIFIQVFNRELKELTTILDFNEYYNFDIKTFLQSLN